MYQTPMVYAHGYALAAGMFVGVRLCNFQLPSQEIRKATECTAIHNILRRNWSLQGLFFFQLMLSSVVSSNLLSMIYGYFYTFKYS